MNTTETMPRMIPPFSNDTGNNSDATITVVNNESNVPNSSCSSKKRGRSNSLLASVPMDQVVSDFATANTTTGLGYEEQNGSKEQQFNASFSAEVNITALTTTEDDNNDTSKEEDSSPTIADCFNRSCNSLKIEKVPFMKSRKTMASSPYIAPNPFVKRHSSPGLFTALSDDDLNDFLNDVDVSSDEEEEDDIEYSSSVITTGGGLHHGHVNVTNACGTNNVANKSKSIVDPDLIKRVHSSPALYHSGGSPEIIIFGHGSASMRSNHSQSSSSSMCNPLQDTNPHEYFKTIVESFGYSSESLPALSVDSYFLEHTEEQIAAYDNRITNAVRGEDINALRQIHEEGKTLQCSNRFGESIVHMACRRGSTKVLQYLLEIANVSGLVRDDFGRTPLHDACWTREPMFDIVKMLVDRWPDLLLVSDKRGHTPLQYVRRDHWGKWCEFLNEYRERLAPREIAEQKVCF